jgi:hypothetical protein
VEKRKMGKSILDKKTLSILLPILLIVSICIASVWIWIWSEWAEQKRILKAQESLALEMGVKVEDYPAPSGFPVGYYYSVLEPGMTLAEVHEMVIGYEQVYHCDRSYEIYYFYSTDELIAIRFMLSFDDDGKYHYFFSEDENSRERWWTDGCELGLIEE